MSKNKEKLESLPLESHENVVNTAEPLLETGPDVSSEKADSAPAEAEVPGTADAETEHVSFTNDEAAAGAAPEEMDMQEIPDEISDGASVEEADAPEAEITVESDEAVPAGRTTIPKQKPYHQRQYLHYGFEQVPEGLDLNGTHEFLKAFGFGNSSLKQARDGKSIAELIEKTFVPNRPGSRYCDFCGSELLGTEYDLLGDGRERCVACTRTAVKDEAEFVEIYQNIIRNLESFYGVRITVPVKIQMVNAKKLHKKLGKTFVPTGNMDGRVLGVAINDKKTGYTILVENGAPRLQATMTMVHELTHIWQYLNWDAAQIRRLYGAAQELQVYEGMAKWSEIQYAYLINEPATAKREEIITRARKDEYGQGFLKYVAVYPLSVETHLNEETPFDNKQKPL